MNGKLSMGSDDWLWQWGMCKVYLYAGVMGTFGLSMVSNLCINPKEDGNIKDILHI